MKSTCDALSAPETVSRGLLILARIIAREAISDRLARCGIVSPENQIEDAFQNAPPIEKVAGM